MRRLWQIAAGAREVSPGASVTHARGDGGFVKSAPDKMPHGFRKTLDPWRTPRSRRRRPRQTPSGPRRSAREPRRAPPRRTSRSSPASSATTTRSSRRSSTRSCRATISSCSACAARPRAASCARSPACSTTRSRWCRAARFTTTRSRRSAPPAARASSRKATRLPIGWLTRDARYVEKLATPDVTIADMIGDLDPIKAARSGLDLADELTMHYGLVPRANRGIFAINELPDLAGKIQVGLFNILQEGDVQIKGYPIRLPLDVLMVFSANPEDYTARGKIITPLKDRIGSEIRTHYPATRSAAMAITAQEAWLQRGDVVSSRVRARSGRGSRVPGARRSEDRQAIRRQPAAADLAARERRSRTPSGARCSPARRRSSRASPISTRRCRRSPASSSWSTRASCAAPTTSRATSSAAPSATSSTATSPTPICGR